MVLLDKLLGIMIELCTKKCMAILTILMLLVTILVLLIENEISIGRNIPGLALSQTADENKTAKNCWLHEKFKIRKECTYCTEFEKKSNTEHCIETGFKMMVKCAKSGAKWKSCTKPKDPYIDARNFWLFEGGMFVLGLVSFSVVHVRRKNLDKLLMEKIHRQIASGV